MSAGRAWQGNRKGGVRCPAHELPFCPGRTLVLSLLCAWWSHGDICQMQLPGPHSLGRSEGLGCGPRTCILAGLQVTLWGFMEQTHIHKPWEASRSSSLWVLPDEHVWSRASLFNPGPYPWRVWAVGLRSCLASALEVISGHCPIGDLHGKEVDLPQVFSVQ